MLEKYITLLDDCSMCHDQCAFSCPVFVAGRNTSLYPSRKIYFARCMMKGEVEQDEDLSDALYQCCSCNLCKTHCVYAVKGQPREPVPAIYEARYNIIKNNVKTDFIKSAEEDIKKYGNLWGDITKELNELKSINPEMLQKSSVLYLADTETLKLNPESAIAAVRLLNKKQLNTVISEETETGYDIMAAGFFDISVNCANKMAQYLNNSTAEVIVVGSAKSFYALTVWYKELGIKIKKELVLETTYLFNLFIVHFNDYKVKYSDIQNFIKMDKSCVYHDGSFMARYLKNFDMPRMLLKPLFRYYNELRTNKELAKPAAPACFPLGISESIITEMAKIRIKDIEEINPDYVVTSDAASNFALKKYWDNNRVISISEVLLMNYVEMYKVS